MEAIKDLKEALAIYKEIHDKADGNNYHIGFGYIELGELELDRNAPSEALRHFERSMKHWHGIYGEGEMSCNEIVATTYGFIARCHKSIGNDKLASEYKRKCMDMYQQIRKK